MPRATAAADHDLGGTQLGLGFATQTGSAVFTPFSGQTRVLVLTGPAIGGVQAQSGPVVVGAHAIGCVSAPFHVFELDRLPPGEHGVIQYIGPFNQVRFVTPYALSRVAAGGVMSAIVAAPGTNDAGS